jgi:flagellar protein FliJ
LKKFAFRLQKVLDVRHLHEKEKLGLLGREQKILETEEYKLDLFRRETETHITSVRIEQAQPFKVWSQNLNQSYMRRIKGVVEYQQGQVRNQMQMVETARIRYIEARRDTKTIEQIKEKRHEEWKQEIAREETIQLDEFASRSHAVKEADL